MIVGIEDLKGKVIGSIVCDKNGQFVKFITEDGYQYCMKHIQDEDEIWRITDIDGKLENLIFKEVIDCEYRKESNVNNTVLFTDFKIEVDNAYVLIQWYSSGESYYNKEIIIDKTRSPRGYDEINVYKITHKHIKNIDNCMEYLEEQISILIGKGAELTYCIDDKVNRILMNRYNCRSQLLKKYYYALRKIKEELEDDFRLIKKHNEFLTNVNRDITILQEYDLSERSDVINEKMSNLYNMLVAHIKYKL
jgi:L-rhamnose isomerase